VIAEVASGESFTPPPGFEAVEERSFGAARFVLMTYESGA